MRHSNILATTLITAFVGGSITWVMAEVKKIPKIEQKVEGMVKKQDKIESKIDAIYNYLIEKNQR